MRPKVYVTRKMPQKAIDILFRCCDVSLWNSDEAVPRGELLNSVRAVDALLCMPTDKIDSDVLEAAGSRLKIVATMSEGCEHIDVTRCQENGIKIIATPSVDPEQMTDLAIALLLLTTQKPFGTCDTVDNLYVRLHNNNIWNSEEFKSILRKTFGIYGGTEIGRSIATRLRSIGVTNILCYDTDEQIGTGSSDIVNMSFDDLLQESDVICVCCRLNNRTRRAFNKETFGKMKRSAVLLNLSASEAIHNSDLYSALKEGELRAAGLNVSSLEPVSFKDPLSGLFNCVLGVPQFEVNSNDFRIKMATSAAQRIVLALQNI